MKKTLATILTLAMGLTLLFSTVGIAAQPKEKLLLWHRWSGTLESLVAECVDAFEAENPDIEVEIVSKTGEYFNMLQSMIADAAAGNQSPDIFIGGYAMANYIATEMDLVTPNQLSPNEESLKKVYDRFDKNILKVAAFKDIQVGLPFALSTMVMWVNMDIWHEAGLTENDIPKTYEDLTMCLEQIVKKTGKNGASLATNDNWIDQQLSMSHGGSIITDDLDHISFANDAVIAEMTWWQDLYNRGLSPKCTYTEMTTMFYSGDTAVYCATCMNEATFKEYCQFNYKAFPLPAFKGYNKKLAVGGSSLISFTQDSSRYGSVWRLMDFLCSDEAMHIWQKSGYICPTNAEVNVSESQQVAIDQLPVAGNYLCWPGGAAGLEIDAIWTNTRNSILHDGLPIAETLQKVEEECNELLD